ncbi:unnamed protein product [Cunninghamella blakesleeana]
MTSRENLLNTSSLKRPHSYENNSLNRKFKGSPIPSKVNLTSSLPLQQQQQKSPITHNNHVNDDYIKQNGSRLTTFPDKNHLFKEPIGEEENKIDPDDIINDSNNKNEDKDKDTDNEKISKIELERDELKNKMVDLKHSYQQRVKILVDELEKYKKKRKNHIHHDNDDTDEINQLKKESEQLQSFVDQLSLQNSNQITQIKYIEDQLNHQLEIVEKLKEENKLLKQYHQNSNNNNNNNQYRFKYDDFDDNSQHQEDRISLLEKKLICIKEDLQNAILQNSSTFLDQENYIQLLEDEKHQLENRIDLLQVKPDLLYEKDEYTASLETKVLKLGNQMAGIANGMKGVVAVVRASMEERLESKATLVQLKQEMTEKEEIILTLEQDKKDLKQNYDDLQDLYLQTDKTQQHIIKKLSGKNDLLKQKYSDDIFEMKQKHTQLLHELNIWKQRARELFE